MQTFNFCLNKRVMVFCIQILLIAILAGCSKTGNHGAAAINANSLNLAAAQLPHYQVGTKYIYSNGTWEEVVETGASWVKWTDHKNSVSIGSPDFTYKRSQWNTSKRSGSREFKPAEFWLEEATTTLWPLWPGNKNRFDEFGSWSEEEGFVHTYDSFWRCEVEGTEKVSVPAGDFDTWRITCKRYSTPSTIRIRALEYKTWNYAPAVGHWVREVRDYDGARPTIRKELIAVMPPLTTLTEDETEREQIQKQFQSALEFNKKNIPEIWAGQKNRLIVNISPTNTFRLKDGNICRQFSQSITNGGNAAEYYGIACRDDVGRWKIPRR